MSAAQHAIQNCPVQGGFQHGTLRTNPGCRPISDLLFNVGPDVEGLGGLVHSSTAGVVKQLHPFS